jgi:pantoate--beta-alanine ligase
MSTTPSAHCSVVSRLNGLSEQITAWRADGHSIALISTLGAVHRGHLALVKTATREAERVIVCAYRNPLQLGPDERVDRHPRATDKDAEAIGAAGGHLLFTPADFDLFPGGIEGCTRVEVPELSAILCGTQRPWLFPGIVTVTLKLIGAIQPQALVVGERDYQQYVILRRVLTDLLLPTRLVAVPTVREHDGLAVSTMNRQLSVRERNIASRLYEMLSAIRRRLQKGERDYAVLTDFGMKILERAGLTPEYVSIRQAVDLAPARADTARFAVFAAAKLGAVRLTDTVLVKPDPPPGP